MEITRDTTAMNLIEEVKRVVGESDPSEEAKMFALTVALLCAKVEDLTEAIKKASK